MINPRTLERQFRNKNHKQQLTALIKNGLSIPNLIHNNLLQQPAAINALALRRLCQISYIPDPAITRMLDDIITISINSTYENKPLAAACVVSAIQAIEKYFPNLIKENHKNCVNKHLRTLSDYFSNTPQVSTPDQSATSAFILYLLAADANFRNSIDLHAHIRSYQNSNTQYDPQTQTLYRHAMVDIAA